MRRGRRKPGAQPPPQRVDDRAWSARTNVDARDVGRDVVRYMPLPAETGPTWAPDRLSIWPVEGGRYGIDAQYHGATGAQRAEHQRVRLGESGLVATVRAGADDSTVLRLGPLAHQAAWLALEAFLGPPLDLPPVA
ncbi:MAG: hypothetical protein ACLGI5_16010 [Thermoleophilia bacterium]